MIEQDNNTLTTDDLVIIIGEKEIELYQKRKIIKNLIDKVQNTQQDNIIHQITSLKTTIKSKDEVIEKLTEENNDLKKQHEDNLNNLNKNYENNVKKLNEKIHSLRLQLDGVANDNSKSNCDTSNTKFGYN